MVMAQHRWNPDTYAKNARFVSELGEPLLELLRLQPGEKVLDLGCGDGALTEKIVAAGGIVLGVDASPEQVRAARQRGIDAQVCQVESLPFHEEFDAALSNAVLHWVKDQAKALSRIFRSLKRGGRLVAEFGGAGNVATIRGALHESLRARNIDPWAYDPWFFPTAEEYSALLKDQGFEIDSIVIFPRPTSLPGDILGWLETFAQPFLQALPEGARSAYLEEVRERVSPELFEVVRGWFADYVRLRFRAFR